jgi:hypothetical protein
MELLIVGALFAVGLLFLAMPALIKAETRKKRRSDPRYMPPATIGVMDEVFHPSAYYAAQEIESQKELPAPAPLPGDPTYIPFDPPTRTETIRLKI